MYLINRNYSRASEDLKLISEARLRAFVCKRSDTNDISALRLNAVFRQISGIFSKYVYLGSRNYSRVSEDPKVISEAEARRFLFHKPAERCRTRCSVIYRKPYFSWLRPYEEEYGKGSNKW